MIITGYLVREMFKKQSAIFVILLLIFFCQKLIKILSSTIKNEIPINLIFYLIALGISEIIQFILPLSFVLGLLIALDKLHAENEIIIMRICGLSRASFIKATMILAIFISIISIMNIMWIGPWSSRYHKKIMAEIKENPNVELLTQGQFHEIGSDHSVLFIENINNNRLYNVFFSKFSSKNNIRPFLIFANSGQLIKQKNGSKLIILNTGMYFEGIDKISDFRVTNFQNYQTILDYHPIEVNQNDIDQMDMLTLWNTSNKRAKIEFHWRLILIFILFILALMVVPLSEKKNYRGHIFSTLPTLLLYLIFFFLQTIIKSNGGSNKIQPIWWMWIVSGIYLLLAILLNLSDTMLMRRIRFYFISQKM